MTNLKLSSSPRTVLQNYRQWLAAFSFLAVLILSNQAGALTVPESPPSAWNKGSFGVQTSTEYFFSHKNYEETRGSYDALVNGNKWTSFENRIRVRYGFSQWLSLYAGVGGNGSSATSSGLERSNSAITDLYIGGDFLLARRWWRVVPEFEASYAVDQYQRGQFSPVTNNGASFANAGVFFFKPYRYLRFEGYLGFHFPGDDFAKLFRYSLGTEVAMLGAFTVGAAIQGYETVIGDGTSNVERRFTQTTADATSQRFLAFNPALLEARGWIGLRFDRSFGLRLGYAKTLNGVRTAEGQSILLSLYYNSVGQGAIRRPISNRSRIENITAPPTGASASGVTTTTTTTRTSRTNEFQTVPEPNDPELFDPADESLDSTERLFDR